MDEHYIAENGTVDSLRLETSRATPEQQRLLHDAAIAIKNSMLEDYGQYIQPEALDRVDHVEDRTILMDKDSYAAFYAEWDESGSEVGASAAMTTNQGDIIAINDPSEVWNTFDSDAQQGLIRQFGDEAAAKDVVRNNSVYDNLTHEVIHQFQDYNVQKTFLEIGARYYQRQTTNKLGFGHIIRPDMEDAIDVYSQ